MVRSAKEEEEVVRSNPRPSNMKARFLNPAGTPRRTRAARMYAAAQPGTAMHTTQGPGGPAMLLGPATRLPLFHLSSYHIF